MIQGHLTPFLPTFYITKQSITSPFHFWVLMIAGAYSLDNQHAFIQPQKTTARKHMGIVLAVPEENTLRFISSWKKVWHGDMGLEFSLTYIMISRPS